MQHIANFSIGDFQIGGFLHLGIFLGKLLGFILFFILVRWTVPRFRYDQLMKLGWVIFFEAALINVFLAALIIAAPELTAVILIVGLYPAHRSHRRSHLGRKSLRAPFQNPPRIVLSLSLIAYTSGDHLATS